MGQSARALAAIALADRTKDQGDATLRSIAQWFRSQKSFPHTQAYPLYELMHAYNDNLRIDLREEAKAYFETFPTDHMVSHYPAPFPAPENLYRVPVYVHDGEPDVRDMVLSRAAELEMVALDTNALASQFLQGWLMQDRYMMRSGLGVTYEFLWANPYQPGLSYFHEPLVFHSSLTGHVFARTSWDEDATWIGYFDGHIQLFRDGGVQNLKPGATVRPVQVGDAMLMTAPAPGAKGEVRFDASSEAVFLLGLAPDTWYDVEPDDQELSEAHTDSGGTLVLAFPPETQAAVRIRKSASQ